MEYVWQKRLLIFVEIIRFIKTILAMTCNWISASKQLEVEKSLQIWQFSAWLCSSARALGLAIQQCSSLLGMIHHLHGESYLAGLPCVCSAVTYGKIPVVLVLK